MFSKLLNWILNIFVLVIRQDTQTQTKHLNTPLILKQEEFKPKNKTDQNKNLI